MSNSKVESAIKGSIVSPEAAQEVIKALASSAKVSVAGGLTKIVDPSSATAEDVATLLNAVIDALKG